MAVIINGATGIDKIQDGVVAKENLGTANSLLAEYEVTGSPASSIDITGLDLNTHKSYRLEIEFINATAGSVSIYAYVNNDTTATNYYMQYVYRSASAAAAANRNNNPDILTTGANGRTSSVGFVQMVDGYTTIISHNTDNIGTSVAFKQQNLAHTVQQSNLTQLTLTATVASSLGVGTKVRIYRGDV